MKKLMTLVLAVCMLLAATAAFAEEPVLQNENAHTLVGGVIVLDAAGQVVNTITDPAQITFINKTEDAAGTAFAKYGLITLGKYIVSVDNADMIQVSIGLPDTDAAAFAIATVDGLVWNVVESSVSDNVITVKAAPGMIAVVAYSGEGTAAVGDSFVNDNFTPSVSAKASPEVRSAAIVDSKGNVVKAAEIGVNMSVTPVSAIQSVEDTTLYADLTEAFYQVVSVQSLEEIGLEGVAGMVVRDLFEIALIDDALHGIFELSVTFEAEAPDAVAVMGEDGWKLLDAENVIDNGDGTVTVVLSELGAVAFLVNAAGQNAVTSPAT